MVSLWEPAANEKQRSQRLLMKKDKERERESRQKTDKSAPNELIKNKKKRVALDWSSQRWLLPQNSCQHRSWLPRLMFSKQSKQFDLWSNLKKWTSGASKQSWPWKWSWMTFKHSPTTCNKKQKVLQVE